MPGHRICMQKHRTWVMEWRRCRAGSLAPAARPRAACRVGSEGCHYPLGGPVLVTQQGSPAAQHGTRPTDACNNNRDTAALSAGTHWQLMSICNAPGADCLRQAAAAPATRSRAGRIQESLAEVGALWLRVCPATLDGPRCCQGLPVCCAAKSGRALAGNGAYGGWGRSRPAAMPAATSGSRMGPRKAISAPLSSTGRGCMCSWQPNVLSITSACLHQEGACLLHIAPRHQGMPASRGDKQIPMETIAAGWTAGSHAAGADGQQEQPLKQHDAAFCPFGGKLHRLGPGTGQQAGPVGKLCMQMGHCEQAVSGSLSGGYATAESGSIAGAA